MKNRNFAITQDRFREDLQFVGVRWWIRPTVKILIVVDAGISMGSSGFGLGKVIDEIESNSFYNWVNFDITGATREGGASINSSATSKQFTYRGFRFNMSGFDINDFHQVWFFGFNPGNDGVTNDSSVNQSVNKPLTNGELRILTKWMNEKDGGVFAVGDHHYLGASMCSRIPRVRSMRKWTNAQGVPPISGFNRKDTNQYKPIHNALGEIPFDAQSDDLPQPIEVLKRRISSGPIFNSYQPHPILCGVSGVIDTFPDHAHEGEVLGKRYDGKAGGVAVNTSRTYSFSGFSGREYPNGRNGNPKPEPEIIALGKPTNFSLIHNKGITNTTPFGLVSVYNGEHAEVGRVAVDSTWHHWFNINLNGFSKTDPNYTKIRNYFKNIAVWLSPPDKRKQMLSASLWNAVIISYDPMRFSIQDSVWRLGRAALDILGRTASQCTRREWILDLIRVRERDVIFFPPKPDPCLSCPPFELLEAAVLGGILKEMVPLVEKYRGRELHERQQLNLSMIGKCVNQGIKVGFKEYQKSLKISAANMTRASKLFPRAIKKINTKAFIPQVPQVKLKFSLDRILINNPLLNFIIDKDYLKLGIRFKSNEIYLDKSALTLPRRGGLKFESIDNSCAKVIEFGSSIFSGVFDENEEFIIGFYLISEETIGENKFHEMKFSGNPENWIKHYTPDLNQLSQEGSGVGVWLRVD